MRTCDEHFLSLFLDWSTRNRVLFPRSYHLGECRRSLRAETGGTCREYERGRLSSGFSAASRRGPGASSNHANGPFSSMKFEDTLPREELLFEYTKSVKNGTIFDRTGLDEIEDIFLKRERKKDY